MGRSGLNIRLLLAVGLALFSVFKYYTSSSVNPVTGEKQRVNLTPEQEIAMGLQSAPQMAAEFGGLYPDQKVQNWVKAIGQKLVNSSQAKNAPYQFDFHVLADQNTVNAFALPGGQIFITVALLSRLDRQDQRVFESQLAGILGHEIGHVINRHSAEQIAESEFASGIVNAVAVGTSDPYGSGGMSGAQIAQVVSNMMTMKHGRDDELESDVYGVNYMHSAGYDPIHLIRVMEILKEASGGGERDEFTSTHPSSENRIAKIKEAIEKLKGANTLQPTKKR